MIRGLTNMTCNVDAERIGPLPLGEEMSRGRPSCFLQLLVQRIQRRAAPAHGTSQAAAGGSGWQQQRGDVGAGAETPGWQWAVSFGQQSVGCAGLVGLAAVLLGVQDRHQVWVPRAVLILQGMSPTPCLSAISLPSFPTQSPCSVFLHSLHQL